MEFLAFCRYLRSLYPPEVRLPHILENFSAHQGAVHEWATHSNLELASTPHDATWLNRTQAQLKALRDFCRNGTDHPDHLTQARLIRRYIAWRDAHLDDAKLRHVVRRAKAAKVA